MAPIGAYVTIGVIVFFIFILLVIVVVFFIVENSPPPPPENPNPIFDVSLLPDISGLQCCVVNGQILDRSFIPEYNAVVSTIPTGINNACFNSSPAGTDPNQQEYETCLALVTPQFPEEEFVNPVARKGLNKLYYILNTTNIGCIITQPCLTSDF
jgi:hypothetical protein